LDRTGFRKIVVDFLLSLLLRSGQSDSISTTFSACETQPASPRSHDQRGPRRHPPTPRTWSRIDSPHCTRARSTSPPVVMLRAPGVSQVHRPVSKLFANPTKKDPAGFREFRGEVIGCKDHPCFGMTYVVRWEDGDEEQLVYEELMPILLPEDERASGRVGRT